MLTWDPDVADFVQVCDECGHGPCTTFNGRCLSCHEASLLPLASSSDVLPTGGGR